MAVWRCCGATAGAAAAAVFDEVGAPAGFCPDRFPDLLDFKSGVPLPW